MTYVSHISHFNRKTLPTRTIIEIAQVIKIYILFEKKKLFVIYNALRKVLTEENVFFIHKCINKTLKYGGFHEGCISHHTTQPS